MRALWKQQHFLDLFKMHVLVFIWGFTAVLGKILEEYSVTSATLVLYRTLICAVLLALFFLIKKEKLTLSTGKIFRLLAIGCIIGLHWVAFFASIQMSNVSMALIGMTTCSIWTTLFSPFITKKKIDLGEVGLGLVIVVGMYWIFKDETKNLPAIFVSVFGALLAAIFTLLNERIVKSVPNHYLITMYEMVGAFLVVAIGLPFFVEPDSLVASLYINWQSWSLIFILAVVCTIYPFAELIELLKRLDSYTVNFINNLEPVYGMVMAMIVFKEYEILQPSFYVGSIVIFAAVFAKPYLIKDI